MSTSNPAFRRFAADGALVLGGGAAILLQLGDPVVAAGVAAHSAFARDPVRRLRSTLTYVYAVSLAEDELAGLAARGVDRAHAGVPGARDADHQLWVAATLHAMALRVHEAVAGPVPDALRDEVLAGFGRLGSALQLPPERWPATPAAFDAYWAEAVAALEVGGDARAVCAQLLHPAVGPWWLHAAMPIARLATAGLLPEPVRAAYGLPWSAARARRYRALLGVVRTVLRATPRRLRELPSRRLLAGLAGAHAA